MKLTTHIRSVFERLVTRRNLRERVSVCPQHNLQLVSARPPLQGDRTKTGVDIIYPPFVGTNEESTGPGMSHLGGASLGREGYSQL